METNTWKKSKRDDIIKNFIDNKYEKKQIVKKGQVYAISTYDQTQTNILQSHEYVAMILSNFDKNKKCVLLSEFHKIKILI